MRIRIFAAGLFALLLGVGAGAADVTPPPPPQDELVPPPPPPPDKRGRKERGFGPFVWRAFSRLTEQQRLEMLKLQSSDPEQFRQKMRELGEALRNEERARFAELRKAVETIETELGDLEKQIAAWDAKFAAATDYNEADYKAYNDLKARYDHQMHEWEKASYELEITEEQYNG